MNQNSVAITGLGLVSCHGLGVDLLFQAALNEKSGIQDGLGSITPSTVASIDDLYPEVKLESTSTKYAYFAIKQAMKNASWSQLEPTDGFILATTTGQISIWEAELFQFLGQKISAQEFSRFFAAQSLGTLLTTLTQRLQFSGSTLLTTSACSAATQALALASAWVESGKVNRCLVGGTEALSVLTVEGFRSLQLLSPLICKPFDEGRSGINLSEGAAFFCIEKNRPSPSKIQAYLSGFGFSTDAYHLASPHPEGEGCFRAMSAALQKAQLLPKDIQWVHAHGTGSIANDQAEGLAIHRLFHEHPLWVSSTKPIHGHALGASGAIESALCIDALSRGIVLKTAGLNRPDPKIPVRHPLENISMPIRHILKNTLGFGGNNAALVFSKELNPS